MKTYNNLYPKIYDFNNLKLAYKKARKGKTKKHYVIDFHKNLLENISQLQNELKFLSYRPKPLKTFILRDPKTRKISISDFRDRIVHHALCNIIEPIFEKIFIYDSYANRKNKGNLEAVKRFHHFTRKVSRNGEINGRFNNNQIKGYCLKADIKHYFQEIDHKILLRLIKKKISDKNVLWLTEQILSNNLTKGKGMPIGNLTSQFFANVYLNELDYFIKHKLKAKYYLRYVDDFIILHSSKLQLRIWEENISKFIKKKLDIELHEQKTRVIPLSRGIDFVGFRNFYYLKLLRKRNARKMFSRIEQYRNHEISCNKLLESYQGWQAYAMWANTYKLRKSLYQKLITMGGGEL